MTQTQSSYNSDSKEMNFTIFINSTLENVWHKMLDQETYKVWTKTFEPTSHYKGSWEKGQEIRFLDSKGQGMLGVINENRPLEYIEIEFLGNLTEGEVIDTTSDIAKQVIGGKETYTFASKNGGVELKITSGTSPELKDYMLESWQKSLSKLKEICEE